MSVKVMARVWAHSKCSGTELVTVLALADWADDEGWSWPSLPKLAQKVRLGVRQLCKVLNDIEQHTGEIQRERSSGGRNKRTRYRVTITENSVTDNSVVGNSVVENSVIQAQKTVSQTTGALIRHRSVNKKENTESDKLPDSSLSPKSERKQRRSADIPPDLQLTVSRVVAKINELGGTHYQDDRPDALHNLIARLNDGRTEAECLAVVESRHAAWTGNNKMLEYFRPSTLF